MSVFERQKRLYQKGKAYALHKGLYDKAAHNYGNWLATLLGYSAPYPFWGRRMAGKLNGVFSEAAWGRGDYIPRFRDLSRVPGKYKDGYNAVLEYLKKEVQ